MQPLYHGGAAAALPSMQRNGILPRAISKANDNWAHTVTSNKNAVYLTDAYGWHFAAAASNTSAHGVIVEVDRDRLIPWLLCPDEDVLEQGTRKLGPTKEEPNLAPIEWSMKQRTLHYRRIARRLPGLADQSLEHMGTAAYYGPIPWSAVTRYVVIDWKRLDSTLFYEAVDSQVSMLNYSILAPRHRAFTKWFFGDEVTPAELAGYDAIQSDAPLPPGFAEMLEKHNAAYARAMAKRDGLEVVDLRKQEAA